MRKFYVGLMSGTSMDGIDAVLVRFGDSSVAVGATHSQPYPAPLRAALIAAAREPLHVELDPSGDLDRQVGEAFSAAALAVIKKSRVKASDISAIGSHGQTLRHQPNAAKPFSLQIGDADIIAAATGVPTVANFRQADIAAGGQGAPLVPPFHRWLLGRSDVNRVVLNIGGIANITVLPAAGAELTGFDTGPGNGLMDAWVHEHLGKPYDNNGEWAASGVVSEQLLERFLKDAYFRLPPPKSTGFEYFNPSWLKNFGVEEFQPADVQATLCELTSRSIALAIRDHADATGEVFVCGGGSHNAHLLARLRENLQGMVVASTSEIGLDPDWVEAVAFAWLAKRSVEGLPGNAPSVTGASQAVILGELHYPPS